MLVISVGVGIYYNVIISWTLYYFFATLQSLFGAVELPWTTCGNQWNTEGKLRVPYFFFEKYIVISFDPNVSGCQQLHAVLKPTADSSAESSTMLASSNRTFESAASEYFSRNMLQISDAIDEPGDLRMELVLCLGLAWALVFFALLKGVKSFGKAVYFTALFPYVILTILLVKGLTLPGAIDGVIFYITPKWHKLLEVGVWADAAIQIFFSLGPCWGALITLASYNKFSNNCFRDAVFIGFANCLTSFFAGFVVFSFVGFMAYELDKSVDEVAETGPGLAFVVYPEAVSLLPGAKMWALLFFTMLLALGFGTQFSILETIVTIILDAWPTSKNSWKKPSHFKVEHLPIPLHVMKSQLWKRITRDVFVLFRSCCALVCSCSWWA